MAGADQTLYFFSCFRFRLSPAGIPLMIRTKEKSGYANFPYSFLAKKRERKENFLARNPCLHHGLFSFVCLRGIEEASSYHCECALLRYASRWRRRQRPRRHTCAQEESMNFARHAAAAAAAAAPLLNNSVFPHHDHVFPPLSYASLSLSLSLSLSFPPGSTSSFPDSPSSFLHFPQRRESGGRLPHDGTGFDRQFPTIKRKKALMYFFLF